MAVHTHVFVVPFPRDTKRHPEVVMPRLSRKHLSQLLYDLERYTKETWGANLEVQLLYTS